MYALFHFKNEFVFIDVHVSSFEMCLLNLQHFNCSPVPGKLQNWQPCRPRSTLGERRHIFKLTIVFTFKSRMCSIRSQFEDVFRLAGCGNLV